MAWKWVVVAVNVGAYVPTLTGGWQHPQEINIAAYCMWLALSVIVFWSLQAQGFAGWCMPLGFIVGDLMMLALASVVGGSFNVGHEEAILLFGIFAAICVWLVAGEVTGARNLRVLYLCAVAADIISFYPQVKQYLLPHETPTPWLLFGWAMWTVGAFINLTMVEKIFSKLYLRQEPTLLIIEKSAFSIENGVFMLLTTTAMFQ